MQHLPGGVVAAIGSFASKFVPGGLPLGPISAISQTVLTMNPAQNGTVGALGFQIRRGLVPATAPSLLWQPTSPGLTWQPGGRSCGFQGENCMGLKYPGDLTRCRTATDHYG